MIEEKEPDGRKSLTAPITEAERSKRIKEALARFWRKVDIESAPELEANHLVRMRSRAYASQHSLL